MEYEKTDGEPEVLVGYEYFKKILFLLDHARDSIYIGMYIWRVQPLGVKDYITQINDAVERAYSRGVKVRCIVHFGHTTSHLRKWHFPVKKYGGSNCFHNKLVVVDSLHCIIGSHNLSNFAILSNIEVSLYINSATCANRIIDFLNSQPTK